MSGWLKASQNNKYRTFFPQKLPLPLTTAAFVCKITTEENKLNNCNVSTPSILIALMAGSTNRGSVQCAGKFKLFLFLSDDLSLYCTYIIYRNNTIWSFQILESLMIYWMSLPFSYRCPSCAIFSSILNQSGIFRHIIDKKWRYFWRLSISFSLSAYLNSFSSRSPYAG